MDRFLQRSGPVKRVGINHSSIHEGKDHGRVQTPATFLRDAKQKDKKKLDDRRQDREQAYVDLSSDEERFTTAPTVRMDPLQVVPAGQRASIKSILMPQRHRKRYTVSFRVNPSRMAHILDQPVVILDDDDIRKQAKKVSLKNGRFEFPERKQEVGKADDITRPVIILDREDGVPGKPSKSITEMFFKEVSDRFAQIERNPVRKRVKKHMDLPLLKKNSFLVEDKAERNCLERAWSRPLLTNLVKRKGTRPPPPQVFNAQNHMEFYRRYREAEPSILEDNYDIVCYPDGDIEEELMHEFEGDSRLERFIGRERSLRNDSRSQWCDLFRPRTHRDILQNKTVRDSMQIWLADAFRRLKKVDRAKRMEMLKRIPKQHTDNEMADFIVYDDDESMDNKNNVAFVPSLIISGPTGCGKTAAVYATVKEELHGHVFELNSSQPRGKRDISFHLKQIGTTQIVNHGVDSVKDNTVILFDDVDLIDDEESDKEFWAGVTELLVYTYRPVIFTTSDLRLIPKRIVDESTVLSFEDVKEEDLNGYLKMISICRGFKFDSEIFRKVERGGLRGSLMQLQMFSYQFESLKEGLVEVRRYQQERECIESVRMRDFHADMDYFMGTINDSAVSTVSTDRYNAVEFYSLQYFVNGSRSRCLRYGGADDYLETNPGSSFSRLSNSQMASEIIPFAKSMARKELERIQKADLSVKRRFDIDPAELFNDL